MGQTVAAPDATGDDAGSVSEVARLAARLGATAFGGPAAHIALLQDEIVHKRGWIGQTEFNHMLGLANLLPGPNSTEMVMHAGFRRAGYRGLLVAGICFILPGALMTLVLAAGYRHWGNSTAGQVFLTGVQAAVVAVLVQALWRLTSMLERRPAPMAGIAILAMLSLLGFPELPLLFAGGAVLGAARIARRRAMTWSIGGIGTVTIVVAAAIDRTQPYSPGRLFLTFLKIGGLLYGSGYVLVSLLQGAFVDQLGWLSTEQIVDAVAAGQLTPGPLFTTSTFIGYQLGGVPGATIATVAIFLPAFVFVAFAAPLLRRISGNQDALDLLHGVSIAAIALLLAITISLGREMLNSAVSVSIGALAAFALLKLRLNAAVVIAGGGALALLLHMGHWFQ